eukprot:1068459-Pelagomonas_calceolata.AAC.1
MQFWAQRVLLSACKLQCSLSVLCDLYKRQRGVRGEECSVAHPAHPQNPPNTARTCPLAWLLLKMLRAVPDRAPHAPGAPPIAPHRFDFLITLASFAEMLVELIPGPHAAAFNGGLTAIRLLRLFRLARYWEGLNQILQILGHALSSGIYLLALVLLF